MNPARYEDEYEEKGAGRLAMMARALPVAMMLAMSACASNEPQPAAPQSAGPGSDGVTYELAGTRWALQQLNGEPVKISEGGREAYVYLNSADGSVVGYAGCNRISSTYKQNGAGISFGDVTATRMFCQDMPTETALLQAMKVAAGWRIAGPQLELLDSRQTTVARFEARNL